MAAPDLPPDLPPPLPDDADEMPEAPPDLPDAPDTPPEASTGVITAEAVVGDGAGSDSDDEPRARWSSDEEQDEDLSEALGAVVVEDPEEKVNRLRAEAEAKAQRDAARKKLEEDLKRIEKEQLRNMLPPGAVQEHGVAPSVDKPKQKRGSVMMMSQLVQQRLARQKAAQEAASKGSE